MKPRLNGFSLPLSKEQLALLLFGTANALFVSLFTVELHRPADRPLFSWLTAIIYLAWLSSLVLLTASDPTDSLVRLELQQREKDEPVQVDPNLDFCILCKSNVQPGAKHCRRCNRCTAGFDHHCDWVNNCVGRKNYARFAWFLAGNLALFLTCSVAGSVCLQDYLLGDSEYSGAGSAKVNVGLSLGFAAASGCVALRVGYLIGQHVYLRCKKMTVFEYITQKEQKADKSTSRIVSKQRNRSLFKGNEVVEQVMRYKTENTPEEVDSHNKVEKKLVDKMVKEIFFEKRHEVIEVKAKE